MNRKNMRAKQRYRARRKCHRLFRMNSTGFSEMTFSEARQFIARQIAAGMRIPAKFADPRN